MAARGKYYVTTAIPYVNGAPHIGHAYEAIATDCIARFKRLDGYDVLYMAGSDEHGLKMLQTAAKEGLDIRTFATRNTERFKAMLAVLDCSNDDYVCTTEERHFRSVQELWRRMAAKGDIYLGTYSGWYSVRDEAFYDESETKLRDDGVRVGPQGTPVEWTEDKTYFFRLSAFQDRLLAHYEANPDFILPPERRNEVVSFVRGGLQDLSVSRTTFEWGVPVPDAPGHVMYVWVDALTNYITGAGFPDEASERFKAYWPADLHMIGKDITRFHAIYWPAFLMSAGVELPKRVYGHGFIYNQGEKMSKSVGNVLDPFALVQHYGVDQVRYFFLREVPFGQDGSYSHEAIVNRTNADLANDLGNLAQRSLSMISKNCNDLIPEAGALADADKAMLAGADGMLAKARQAMDRQQINKYLEAVWDVVADANRYFAGEAPWALKKTDPRRMGTVLYVTAEVVRQAGILAQAVMPSSCARLLDQLALSAGERTFETLGAGGRLKAGARLGTLAPVFPRYVEPESKSG
ncbi:MAG: methionine--tRNA ligase [Hyphomicrobiaceae bacterium]